MPRPFHDMQLRLRPGLGQIPGVLHLAGHVIAAVDNHRRNMADQRHVTQQLVIALQEAQMREVVVFNTGERQREIILAKRSRFTARQQRDRLPFPHAPQLGRFKLHLRIGRGQPLPVGGDHVLTFFI